jgi:hypothetical protein
MLVQPFTPVPVTVYVVVEDGVTTLLSPAPRPLSQLYDTPPEAVNVELAPEQMAAGVAVAVIVGAGFTVTVTLAVLLQPLASVPVTVYVVVMAGVTVLLAPAPSPLSQV